MDDEDLVADAAQAVYRFWAALAENDDASVLALIDGMLLASVGAEAAVAARLRDAYELTRAQAARIRVSSEVRITPENVLIFVCTKGGPGRPGTPQGELGIELVEGAALGVAQVRGAWRIIGQWDGPWPEGIRYVDVPDDAAGTWRRRPDSNR